MAEYRDPLGALLERISHLETQLAETRAAHPAAGDAPPADGLEEELLRIESSWHERRERIRASDERRRKRVRIASTILFFLMCAGSIAAMAVGQVPFGLFFFVASVTGWALAGLQNGRNAVLVAAYEDDRVRVERALAQLRRALPRVRIEVAARGDADAETEGRAEADDAEASVDATGEKELAREIDRLAR